MTQLTRMSGIGLWTVSLILSFSALAHAATFSGPDSAITRERSALVIDSRAAAHFIDAFGVRLGVGEYAHDPGVRPVFNPYYETSLGPMTLSAELMLSYLSFSVLDIPTFHDFRFESYGFRGSLRWSPTSESALRPFYSAGIGFDVFSDRVSASLPFALGGFLQLSQASQLELSGLITPIFYFGRSPGVFYGATVGLRFPNFSR